MEKPSTTNMTLRYLLALGLLALLALAGYFVLLRSISAQESNAAVVNVSGRQRMLSQRTALLSLRLVHTQGEAPRAAVRQELLDTIALMERSHNGLVNGDPEMNLPGDPSPTVRAMYFQAPLFVDLRVRQYLAAAKALAAAPDAELTPDNPQLQIILASYDPLLQGLDALVKQYEEESDADVAQVQRLDLWVLGATLLALVMTALFVFRPMVRRVQQGMRQLRALNETLEQRVRDRTHMLSQSNDALAREILERKRAEEALRQSEERYRAIASSATDAIVVADSQGRIVGWNKAAVAMFGYEEEEALGKPLTLLMPERYREAHQGAIERLRRRGRPRLLGKTVELHGLRKDGTEFPLELSLAGWTTGEGRFYSGIIRDISERKRAEEELRRLNEQLQRERAEIEALNRSLEEKVRERTRELSLANEELRERNRQLLAARAQAATDALTGLGNHRAFQERIRKEVARAQASGERVGLIMLDIDGFKQINDRQGHLAGDEMLAELALRLMEVVGRENAYRYGGDEFAVILLGSDRQSFMAVAEQLRQAIARGMEDKGEVTVSLGVAIYPEMAGSAEELIYKADAAMYWAKAAGKNQVKVADRGRLRFGMEQPRPLRAKRRSGRPAGTALPPRR